MTKHAHDRGRVPADFSVDAAVATDTEVCLAALAEERAACGEAVESQIERLFAWAGGGATSAHWVIDVETDLALGRLADHYQSRQRVARDLATALRG